MKCRVFIFILFLIISRWAQCSERYISANELGSWSWNGFNLGYGKLKEVDVRDMVESGAKVARFHLEARRCPVCTRYDVAEEDSIRLRRVVGYAKKYGLKIIIVLDTKPRANEADFWESEERKMSLQAIWGSIAKQYANETTVAAYDLLNEPHPPDATWSGGPSRMWPQLIERFALAIRSQDPNHALIVESAPIALPGAIEKLKPVSFENVVYSFHFYEPHRLTHQGIIGFPLGLNYPGYVPGRGYWDKGRLSEYLEPVRKFKSQYHVPIQVGEFGFIRWAPAGSRNRYIKDFLDLVYKEQWGWLYHAYREWEGWDAEIDSNNKNIQIRSPGSPDFELIKSYMDLPISNK